MPGVWLRILLRLLCLGEGDDKGDGSLLIFASVELFGMIRRFAIILLAFLGGFTAVSGQVFDAVEGDRFTDGVATENVVVADGFWRHWYVQADLDMTLQNPYGYDFKDVFPNGYSFGMDLALGKWFSHQVGIRGKFNWENKLPLLKNDRANWLAPFDQPGVNRERGGYIAAYGEIMLNVHNLFGVYRADRAWNMSVYPRVGVNYNFGVEKGSLITGLGVMNTYRIDERWSLVADASLILTGSGFVGNNESGGTGVGTNANSYFYFGLGAQYDLVGSRKDEVGRLKAEGRGVRAEVGSRKYEVLSNGFWDNWFVLFGGDMSLMNPYKYDFSKVFPLGQTYGLNVAFGKWFTPEFAVRGRVQWENGLIENRRLEWVVPKENPGENYRNGGFGVASVEALGNFSTLIAGYDAYRRWNSSVFVRAGIISQFVVGSASPLMGVGFEESFRLNDRLSLFGAAGYQVTTSEGMGVSGTGMSVSTGTNGFFNIDLGVIVDLGENRFYSGVEAKRKAYSEHALSGHNWARFILNTGLSVGVAYGAKTALKAVIHEERPDHSDDKSFPSGHTTIAFAAARSIDKEFRGDCVWIPVVAYTAATAVGVERVVSEKHHWYDVVAGAALGYGCAELTWWVSDRVFGKGSHVAVGYSGNTVDVAYRF